MGPKRQLGQIWNLMVEGGLETEVGQVLVETSKLKAEPSLYSDVNF